ncbi:MAG TPA: prepilin-type N-terminal cleavage/methylation domain-containing protein [Nitrospirales bacterium]|nr:prepilin-type N-terminal cleavage/methylation domain-containing protein [Nitrospirales bacterium]HIO69040.1 prepilin-type N-terminal cleavage/methylation domain-containing protein [Nitrospirales bacterium]
MNRVRVTQGFTLFEILIAVMILGIALPILFQLFSGTLRAVKKSQDYTHAIALAQQKLEELMVMRGAPLEPESGEGPDGLYWERVVVPANPSPDLLPVDEDDGDEAELISLAPLYEAIVSVRWDADPSSPSTSLHTLVAFAPALPALIEKEELEEPSEEIIP